MIAKSHRWQRSAIAAAAAALFGLAGTGAWALSLGRISVQSALGEPLRAEIDVPDINAEEAASLKASIAAPSAFVAAGVEYNAVMSGMQVSLQRRSDGRAYLRLITERSINDPFVDLILEASWSSGRIMRDYTMLFDPPALRQAAPAPTLAQTSPPPATVTAAPKAPAPEVSAPPAPPAPRASAPAKPPVAPPAPAPAAQATAPTGQVVVKSGDTAGKIAAHLKAPGVSLDQMLVAMMRSSPDAFISNNVNRIKAGAVLNVPSAEVAQAVAPAEASQLLAAQAKDFNAFRRNLALNAPAAAVTAADRKASGSIQAKVDDKKAASATPDKLTLSKGAIQSKADAAKVAQELASKQAAAREAELAKNISDLKKAGAALAPAATAPAPAPAAPASKAQPAPAVAVATAPPAAPASVPAASAAASAPKPAASAPASPASKPAVPVPAEEPGFLDDLMEDPLVPLGGALLVALLGAGVGLAVRKRRKSAAHVDSSFLESRLQPDSFFGASGGQRVDTANEGPSSATSMVFPSSQMEGSDDVDPVAEADVYMAYGRDLQAEEILKEALRTHPERLAIHNKLLEIFAKRRDTVSFQASAAQAFALTDHGGPEWAHICEMGLLIDPENPLYRPGGEPTSESADTAAADFGQTMPQTTQAIPVPAPVAVDLDLDLDFSLDEEPASAISDVTGGNVSDQTVKMEAPHQESSDDLDFDISEPVPLTAQSDLPDDNEATQRIDVVPSEHAPLPDLDLSDNPSDEDATDDAPTPAAGAASGMLEFDIGGLSLDLDTPAAAQDSAPAAPEEAAEDPLETKLALAEEFVSIGDEDGARALIEEVVAEATGELRAKAQRALAELS